MTGIEPATTTLSLEVTVSYATRSQMPSREQTASVFSVAMK
jgi:hypothetical protein